MEWNNPEDAIEYSYDLKDRLVHAKDWEGAVFTYNYDKNDRLVKEQRTCAGDGENLSRYVYDSRDRLAEKQDAYGVTTERNRYDAMGRTVYRKLADGEEAEFSYGIHGALEAVVSPTSRKNMIGCL